MRSRFSSRSCRSRLRPSPERLLMGDNIRQPVHVICGACTRVAGDDADAGVRKGAGRRSMTSGEGPQDP